MNEAPLPEDVLMGVGALGLCCALVSVVGIVGLVVWLLRARGAPAGAAPPATWAPPAPSGAALHLSVLALSFDATARGALEAALAEPPSTTDGVAHRVALVQRLVHALAGLEGAWQHFGYGEKDLVDLAAAQQSYAAALADFRARAAQPAAAGPLCVVTLVLCTRGQRLGVDRLDTRAQVKALLADRLQVDAATLLGAEVVWAPPEGGLLEAEVLGRYPEMHRLTL